MKYRKTLQAIATATMVLVGVSTQDVARSEDAAFESIPVVNIPLAAWVAAREHQSPDTLPSFSIDQTAVTTFRTFVESLANRDWGKASGEAASLQYRLARIKSEGNWFVVAFDAAKTSLGPTLVVNAETADTDIVFQAPHMPSERGTAEEAVILLAALKGRAAIINGVHRCASRTFTTCDGKTMVCGSLQAYRDSDGAHNMDSAFHAAHLAFAEKWPSSLAVSLHGMVDDKWGVPTSIVLSNGMTTYDPENAAPATRLRFLLARVFSREGEVASCNWPDDLKLKYPRLCGVTNVQGRHVNGIANVCRLDPKADENDSANARKAIPIAPPRMDVDLPTGIGTGRFVHIEQDGRIRAAFADQWAKPEPDPTITAFIDGFREIAPRAQCKPGASAGVCN